MATEAQRLSSQAVRRIVVVGGRSRAATAFRRHATSVLDIQLVTLSRRPVEAMANETVVEVSDNFAPPEQCLQNADALINFAGIVSGREEAALKAVNVDGPIKLAGLAKRLGIRHFVQLSSFHVYGYAENISPNTPVSPRTPYAKSKLAADNALLQMADDNFAVAVLRLPILYGQGLGESFRKLAKLMGRVPLFPVSKQPRLRSTLHCDNLAVLLEAVVRRRAGGVRFGADPEPFSIDLLAEIIGDATGRRPKLAHFPNLVFLPLRLVSNGLYSRLYKSNLVEQRDCVVPLKPFPVSLRTGLKDILPL